MATSTRTKNRIAIYLVQRAREASTVRALFLDRKVSAPPEIAPEIPARRPYCSSTTAMMIIEHTKISAPTIISATNINSCHLRIGVCKSKPFG